MSVHTKALFYSPSVLTGAIALTAGYIVSILFGVFCCPILLRCAGANGTLVIADMTMLVFCLSNISQGNDYYSRTGQLR